MRDTEVEHRKILDAEDFGASFAAGAVREASLLRFALRFLVRMDAWGRRRARTSGS